MMLGPHMRAGSPDTRAISDASAWASRRRASGSTWPRNASTEASVAWVLLGFGAIRREFSAASPPDLNIDQVQACPTTPPGANMTPPSVNVGEATMDDAGSDIRR